MTHHFIIVFAPDDDQPIDHYWNGFITVPIDSTGSPDNAQLFDTKGSARAVLGGIQSQYPNQQVAVVPVTKTVVMNFSSSPEVLPPAPPPSS